VKSSTKWSDVNCHHGEREKKGESPGGQGCWGEKPALSKGQTSAIGLKSPKTTEVLRIWRGWGGRWRLARPEHAEEKLRPRSQRANRTQHKDNNGSHADRLQFCGQQEEKNVLRQKKRQIGQG